MAFRVIREKREAARNKKLNEIFMERGDPEGERISLDQMREVFRMYEVDFDEEAASKACANSGSPDHMNRFEFMKFGKDCKLLDMEGKKEAPETPEKHNKHGWEQHDQTMGMGKGSRLCGCFPCCHKEPPQLDRVELAFKRIDTNHDGVISWKEFQRSSEAVNHGQKRRIFETLDTNHDHVVSLDEFENMANRS